MRIIPKILMIIAISFMLIWIFSLIKCEVLTYKYHDDFEYAYQENDMLGNMEYFKVLSVSKDTARVYYVSENMSSAHVLYFENIDRQWKEVEWHTVWAKSGSASGVIFPYWWHFIYGGF